MLNILFQIIIYPLYAGLETIFSFFFDFFCFNICLTIFVISFLINLICLPLYINAEKLQKQERDIQNKMSKRVECIKKNFKGDERHMLLATYYRQNNYHPIMSLRTSLSLLLQIPFFTAAYFFFSHLQLLHGLSMGIIEDLSKPDNLLHIGSISVNVLPIFMTVINLVAGAIYSREQSKKDKIQIWTLALVFLAILYNSPSGLVLYWTFNNFFSLIKNIGLKSAKPKAFIKTLLLFSAGVFLFYMFKVYDYCLSVLFAFFAFIFLVYLFYLKNREKFVFKIDWLFQADSEKLYFTTCFALWLLIGFVIPSNLIASSPVEFSFIEPYNSPFPFLCITLIRAFGIFIFWGWVLYYFSSEKLKKILPVIFAGMLASFVFNLLFVPSPQGTMSNTLSYNFVWNEGYDVNTIFFNNLAVILCFMVTAMFFFKRKTGLLQKIMTVLIISFSVISVFNISKIYNIYKKYSVSVNHNSIGKSVYSLSKDKKNVIIIMIDRAISSYLPIIFEEKPELKKIYTGFTYYPNTVSYYGHTILAYPALMGGYEYTPINLNKRDTVLMKDKHNEALLLLPLIFKNQGWQATVTDAPWGDYSDVTPSKMFVDRGVKYEKLKGKLGKFYKSKYLKPDKSVANILCRNMLYFSFMKVAPAALKNFVYNDGNYLNVNTSSTKNGLTSYLLEGYAGLFYLPELTDFSSKKSSFIVINNELTHSESFLEYPSYKLTDNPNPGKPINADSYSLMHYHLNAAALLLIGDYLKYLKQNNVYDNTKIIIVSDHGGLNIHNPYIDRSIDSRIMNFNPVLFIKDFNSKGEIKTDNRFMTNADVPSIALDNVVDNPKNPFTEKSINTKEKQQGACILVNHREWNPSQFHNRYKPLDKDSDLWCVKEDIFKLENWSKPSQRDYGNLP